MLMLEMQHSGTRHHVMLFCQLNLLSCCINICKVTVGSNR